jgi:cell division protease FtsH
VCSRNIWYFILIALFLVSLYSLFGQKISKPETVEISKVVEQVQKQEVDKITVESNKLTILLKDNKQEIAYKEEGAKLSDYGITADKVKIDVKGESKSGLWMGILYSFLPVLIIIGFFYWMMRQASVGGRQALSFGETRARLFGPGKTKVTFSDVAGLKEAKQELVEVVEFLKNPGKFRSLGAEIPRGVLLTGPSGTGKTLLAKAVAGEAGVPFFSISASEFVEMFVGVGASRVRSTFQKAKRNAPSIIYIDELDAIGRVRGAGIGGGHDEREQTLNQILVEMDGFETDTRVVVLAATNRPDILDPALLRPGRFDRKIVLDLPDVKEREEILKIHTRGKPLESNVNLERIAKITAGFSGADLRNLTNEAAILAARRNKKKISQNELEESIEKVLLGPERKSHLLSEKEKKITAYHETGHALLSHLLPNCDPVHKISIISRGPAAGYTWSLPTEDKKLHSKAEFEDNLVALLGGRTAEELIFGKNEITTGAQNDLKRATKIAKDMITQYGMSEKLGPITWGEKEELTFLGKELGEQKTYSEETASKIDLEVRNIIEKASKKAKAILSKKKSLLKKVAEKLIKEETLEGDEIERLFPRKQKA